VAGALAAEEQPLSASIAAFDATLRAAPASLSAVDSALRRSRASASAATGPGRGAAALTRTDALLDQIAGSVQPGELPAVLRSLKPVVRDLPRSRRDCRRCSTGPRR